MTQGPKKPSQGGAQAREDRLKAALKANLARRKAQARARSDSNETKDTNADGGAQEQ